MTDYSKKIESDLLEQHQAERDRLDEEIAKREKPDTRVPLDRDPIPGPFEELVREYFERLGSGD